MQGQDAAPFISLAAAVAVVKCAHVEFKVGQCTFRFAAGIESQGTWRLSALPKEKEVQAKQRKVSQTLKAQHNAI